MPSRVHKARAIILRARNLGEADKIFTLLTVEYGKYEAIAKGVRRGKSRVAGKLEFGAEAFLLLHRGRWLDVIGSADILRSSWPAITLPAGYATAHLMIELVDAFCECDLAVPEVYALLNAALGALGAADDPTLLIPRFEARLLAVLGLAPYDADCVRCGCSFEDESAWADPEAGGLSCAGCRPHGGALLALKPQEAANFRSLAAPRASGARAALAAAPAAARAIEAFLSYHLGRRPKASRLVEELRQAAPVGGA
jgi:DNA repair protein RecO (recombination protein O)